MTKKIDEIKAKIRVQVNDEPQNKQMLEEDILDDLGWFPNRNDVFRKAVSELEMDGEVVQVYQSGHVYLYAGHHRFDPSNIVLKRVLTVEGEPTGAVLHRPSGVIYANTQTQVTDTLDRVFKASEMRVNYHDVGLVGNIMLCEAQVNVDLDFKAESEEDEEKAQRVRNLYLRDYRKELEQHSLTMTPDGTIQYILHDVNQHPEA